MIGALEAFERGERDTIEALRLALCRYVHALRAAGTAVEDVLSEMRELVTRPQTPHGATKVPPIAREALAELTLRWCSDEYERSSD